ncbi:hypothetical protein BDV59DRAFT_200280 [Aspergillus ambiguus]|uniref:uncharacterized protein n=1 Tax=Aspergillus ambiguus TaxID=176160 RepID=UPI003CCCB07F
MTTPMEQLLLFGAIEPETPTDLTMFFFADLTPEAGFFLAAILFLTLIFGFWGVSNDISTNQKELWGLIHTYDAQNDRMEYLILTKNAELKTANEKIRDNLARIKQDEQEIERLSSRPSVQIRPWCSCKHTVIRSLRQEIANRDADLFVLRGRLRECENTNIQQRHNNVEKLKSLVEQKDRYLKALEEDFYEQGAVFDVKEKALNDRIAQLEQQMSKDSDGSSATEDMARKDQVAHLENQLVKSHEAFNHKTCSSYATEKALRENISQLEQQLLQKASSFAEMENTLNDQVIQLKKQMSESHTSEMLFNDRIAQLEQQLAGSNADEMPFRDQVAKLDQQLSESHAKEISLNDRIADLEKQLSEHKDQGELKLVTEKAHLEELNARKNKVVSLEQQLVESEAHAECIKCHRLALSEQRFMQKNQELTAQIEDITAQNKGLADQNRGLAVQHRDLIATVQKLLSENAQAKDLAARHEEERGNAQSLIAENQTLASRCHELESMHEPEKMLVAQTARDEALGKVLFLQAELETMQQTMQGIKTACDLTIEQHKIENKGLSEEVNDLQVRVRMAMRDTQRQHEETTKAQQTIKVLENRLSQWESRDGSHEILKRQTGNRGSIQAALEQSKVTIAQKDMEIQELRRGMAKMPSPAGKVLTSDQESLLHEQVRRLRTVVETEKRAREENMIQLGKQINDLTDENWKLTISLSNAKAAVGHRLSPKK